MVQSQAARSQAPRGTSVPRTARRKARKPDRNAIVQEFLPSIRIHAARMKLRLPPHIETDDLVSSGVVGLLDALERFDTSRGIKFKTYAEFRIRGAMLDYLREMDWFPRSARQHASRLEYAYNRLENLLGRPPEEGEVANDLSISVEDLRKQLAMFTGMTVFSLETLQDDDEESVAGLRHILAESALEESREEELTRELKDVLGKAIDMLPEREQQLIAFYYYEDLTLREISRIFNLGEPRVCQLHSQAVLRLRGKLTRRFR
jgi:RNA polymerase sigma factor for flagellar operon FliA